MFYCMVSVFEHSPVNVFDRVFVYFVFCCELLTYLHGSPFPGVIRGCAGLVARFDVNDLFCRCVLDDIKLKTCGYKLLVVCIKIAFARVDWGFVFPICLYDLVFSHLNLLFPDRSGGVRGLQFVNLSCLFRIRHPRHGDVQGSLVFCRGQIVLFGHGLQLSADFD